MKTRKISALAASLGITAALFTAVPMSASADGYVAVNGGDVSFDKYLVMDKDATTPNVSFTYTIAPGEAKAATATTQAISAGPAGAKFKHVDGDSVTVSGTGDTTAKVSFVPTDSAVLDEAASAQKTIGFKDSTPGNEKFATKAITIDLSGVTFTEPGLYRYVITETANTYGGLVSDPNPNRYLDVYVVNKEGTENELEIRASVFQIDDSQPSYIQAITTGDKKSTGFTNSYNTKDLTIEKTVSGNQSSKNKYFAFTVKLVNPTGTDKITINNDDRFSVTGTLDRTVSSVTDSTKYTAETIETANKVTYVTFAEIAAGKIFYLKGGQNVIINGIPEGLGYEIVEAEEEYKPTITVSGDTKNTTEGDIAALAQGIDTISDKKLEADATVKYTNFLGGSIPTGILSTVAGSLGIVAIGITGIAGGMLYLKKKKSEEQ